MNRQTSGRWGFTLIELLIVVAIIGILAAIAVPNFLNAQIRAKVANAVSDMRSLDAALEMYRLDRNMYPPWADANGQNRNPVNRRLVPLTTPIAYIASVPQDPFIYGPPGARVVEDQHEAYVTYDYANAWASIHYHGRTMLHVPFRCSEWRIASAGPNGLMTYGSVPQYDASNGLISDGDILRLGPRSSYPCDDSLVGR